MLNLLVVMRMKILLIFLLVAPAALLCWRETDAQTEPPPAPQITAPIEGAALQGLVQINIRTGQEDFQQAELSFAYASNHRGAWFLIWESDQPLEAGELTVWDTTTISDGDYDLRLTVIDAQGEELQSLVRGLRVRNYTTIETSTPAPTLQQAPTFTSTPTPPPTNTAPASFGSVDDLPANPASLDAGRIQTVILRAGLVVLLIFILVGLYAYLRSRLRSRI